MRVSVGCLVVTIATVGLAPTSRDLHDRYGQPDIERFRARPGISLTVEYGSDHQACAMRIEPTKPLIHTVTSADTVMPEVEVSKILDEVAPTASRGELIKTGGFQASCGVGSVSEYENVSIMRATTACSHSAPDEDVGTMIIFKRDSCAISKNSSGTVVWP